MLNKRPKELDALVFTNYEYPFPTWIPPLVNDYLNQVFNDVTCEYDQLGGVTPHIYPKKEHVEKFLEWAKGRKKIVVACHAGVSRSSAAAYLIACQEWGIDAALSVIHPGTHWPNALIVKYGAQVLDNEDVWKRFVDWYNKACGSEIMDEFSEDLQTEQEHIDL